VNPNSALQEFQLSNISLFRAGVEVLFPDIAKPVFLSSSWLKLAASKVSSYESVADQWTDGSNFQCYNNLEIDNSVGSVDSIETASLNERAGTLEVEWASGFRYNFSLHKLHARVLLGEAVEPGARVRWNRHTKFPEFDYEKVVSSNSSLLELLDSYLQYGLAFLNGAPRDEHEVLNAASCFGAIQRTHLGETFRLRCIANASNLGETTDAISLHIDLVYKQRPPDIQLLHVLNPAHEGGENVFVDALHVIEQLDKEDLRLLRTTPVVFMARSGTVDYRGVHTILAFDGSARFKSVRHNEHKMVLPVGTPDEFYGAFLRFREIIQRSENSLIIRLPRDSMVIFDNARILHGRRAFKGADRDVVGCFIFEDELLSKWRMRKGMAIAG